MVVARELEEEEMGSRCSMSLISVVKDKKKKSPNRDQV